MLGSGLDYDDSSAPQTLHGKSGPGRDCVCSIYPLTARVGRGSGRDVLPGLKKRYLETAPIVHQDHSVVAGSSFGGDVDMVLH